ncbi:MAG: shikimate dehydrogenase family protein, partial [Flavobacteriaceae bacterium]
MAKYGLVGRNIDYSFSRGFFNAKFKREERADQYENFDLSSIEKLDDFLANQSDLKGFNVTIPYKEAIIPFLNELSSTVREIGAVNTVVIKEDGALIGHN